MKSLVQKRWFNMAFALVIIIGITAITLLNPSDLVRVQIEQETLQIDGPDGLQYSIPLGEIQEVFLIEEPVYDENMQEMRKIVIGQYVNEKWGEYSLCASTEIPACIVVYSKEGTYVFNFEDLETTRWFYDEFLIYLEEYTA